MADKPIRKMDAILIRVPDGMKQRLERRAKAAGKSLNAELVSMISAAIGADDELGLRALREERRRVDAAMAVLADQTSALRERRSALLQEIQAVMRSSRTPEENAAADADFEQFKQQLKEGATEFHVSKFLGND